MIMGDSCGEGKWGTVVMDDDLLELIIDLFLSFCEELLEYFFDKDKKDGRDKV